MGMQSWLLRLLCSRYTFSGALQADTVGQGRGEADGVERGQNRISLDRRRYDAAQRRRVCIRFGERAHFKNIQSLAQSDTH